MSVKHVKREFDQVCADYSDMKDMLKYLSEELEKNIVTQEEFDKVLTEFNNVKQRWQSWCYIMNLLYMPNKKEKQRRYKKSEFKSPHEQYKENKEKFKEAISKLND